MLHSFQTQNVSTIHNIFQTDTEKSFANLYGLIIISILIKPLHYGWVSDSWEMEDHMYRNSYSDGNLHSLAPIGSRFL